MTSNTLLSSAENHGHSELERIDYLDGWRGLAILLVLMEHFLGIYEINVGRLGVDIFFVLSGMLMSNILFVKRVPLSTFYKRRISRIFPVFFIFITTVSFCSWMFSLSTEHENYIYNLLFLRSYFPAIPDLWHTNLPIGHLWSLNVEEHSYIVLSVLTLIPFIRRNESFVVLILGFSCIIVHYIYYRLPDLAPNAYYLRTEVVASNLMLSAGYFLIKNKFEKYIPNWLPVMAFILAVVCYSPLTPHWTAKWSLAPFLLAFCVNHLNLLSDSIKNGLSNKYLRLLGIWSFSIYLWQQPFYFIVKVNSENQLLLGLTMLPLAIVAGVLSFYVIENPTRRYINTKW